MKEKWNYVFYLLLFSYLILSAILMFGHGFLLSRKTLNDISECNIIDDFACDGKIKREFYTESVLCSDEEKIRRIMSNPGSPMLCPPTKNRVIMILIDALRYDFTEFNTNIENPTHYQNKLPVIWKTLNRWPNRTRLFRFMADPPTTTLQRIKALVTGSLPTFIDATSNFAAMELQEDNVINQVTIANGTTVLLGDDTWSRLLPGKWMRSHALYSFHTWDLDTVDREVDSKIYEEIAKGDWDLLVAHYLGVDHAGHRYGPHHPEMARKLNETNTRLAKIINLLPPEVILYVVGDHGMTETGDHGGESRIERMAAFFAYCGAGLYGDYADSEPGTEVYQTDFAPTLSAALGRPPPAPSLGNILPSALKKMSISHTLLHLTNNLKQFRWYLIRYGEESQQVSLNKLAHIINATRDQIQKSLNIRSEDEMKKYAADIRALIDNTRGVFREVWIEFDSLSMLRALLLLMLVIFLNWLITEGIPFERIPLIFASSFVRTAYLSVVSCIAVCYIAFYFQYLDDIEHAIYLGTGLLSGVITCALVIMHWDGITQRWYDGRSQFYERFARSALVASAVVLVSNSYVIEEGAALSYLAISVLALLTYNLGILKALVYWLCFAVAMAASRQYRGCREEQGECWTRGLGTSSGQASRAALVLALGSTSAVVAVCRRQIGWYGYGVVAAAILTCAHWAVGWGSLGSQARSRQMARLAWLVIGVVFILLWKRDRHGPKLPLTVLGLLLYLANTLVLGAAYAPPAALVLIAGFLVLNVVSITKNDGSLKLSISARSSSSVACLWALLASYSFYSTGHHATIGHVRWSPAFHAGDPNYLPYDIGRPIIGALILLELFGMPLLFGATVPLLVLWGQNNPTTSTRTQLAAVFTLCLKFALCFALRSFASAIAATIHCRHLMIWGVFTPKLLFESASCAAALLGTLIGATLTAWHMKTLRKSS